MINNYAFDIAEKLGVSDHQAEIDELDAEIAHLNKEIDSLEDELSFYKNTTNEMSLIDDWKIEVFHKYAEHLTPLQLEQKLTQ